MEPTHIYYNVSIRNTDPAGEDMPCEYREQRVQPIVHDPSQYYFSTIRFSVPTSRIPVALVPIQPNQTDHTLTVYSVSLSYGAAAATAPVRWISQEAYSNPAQLTGPRLALEGSFRGNPPVGDGYYFCRSYQAMLDRVNDALQVAFDQLAATASLPSGASAPYVTFDPNSRLFTITASGAFDVRQATPLKLFFDSQLFSLLGAFNHIAIQQPVQAGAERQILLSAGPGSEVGAPITLTQEYSTLANWIPFTSIILTSGTIPIASEGLSAPQVFGEAASGAVYTLPIISDFEAILGESGGIDFSVAFQYSPSGEYRLADMVSRTPLTSFDLQAWWQDKWGQLHALMIPPGEAAHFKFLFRAKRLGV